MAHQLFRLLESVYNVPHLVTTSALRPIVDYLQDRNMNITFSSTPSVSLDDDMENDDEEDNDGFGEIMIDGVLTYKPVYGMCGPVGTSYQGILEQAESLIEGGCHTLIMVQNSPGGQASHCFTTATALREMCDEAGVKLISYIDTLSCSASLALGIVADEVIIHPSAQTGSIGCVVALLDKSEAMAKAGLKPIYIASTPGKTGFNEDGSFSDKLLGDLQEEVTRLGDMFADHVSQYTGIDKETIINMDAKTFHADAALEVGLVNSVMTHKQFAAYLAEIKGSKDAQTFA